MKDKKIKDKMGVGGTGSKQKWRRTDPAQSAGKIFFVVPLHFLALKG